MAQELLYTSAPRGLKPGSRGFCTVQATSGLSPALVTLLEGLSAYRHVAPPGDPSNPVVWSHVALSLGGRPYSVVSRVADAGTDYSGRTNKLAHHVALEPAERPAGGPAWLLSQTGVMRTAFDGEPRTVPPRRLPAGDRPPSVCAAWQEATGDAGWAGVLAEAFLADPSRPAYLVVPAGRDVRRLFEEAIALLPPDRRWAVTFTTCLTTLPQNVTCLWRAVLAGSKEAHESRRYVQALRIDLTEPLGEPHGGSLLDAARTGRNAYAASPTRTPPPLLAQTPEATAQSGADESIDGLDEMPLTTAGAGATVRPQRLTESLAPPEVTRRSRLRAALLFLGAIACIVVIALPVTLAVVSFARRNNNNEHPNLKESTPLTAARESMAAAESRGAGDTSGPPTAQSVGQHAALQEAGIAQPADSGPDLARSFDGGEEKDRIGAGTAVAAGDPGLPATMASAAKREPVAPAEVGAPNGGSLGGPHFERVSLAATDRADVYYVPEVSFSTDEASVLALDLWHPKAESLGRTYTIKKGGKALIIEETGTVPVTLGTFAIEPSHQKDEGFSIVLTAAREASLNRLLPVSVLVVSGPQETRKRLLLLNRAGQQPPAFPDKFSMGRLTWNSSKIPAELAAVLRVKTFAISIEGKEYSFEPASQPQHFVSKPLLQELLSRVPIDRLQNAVKESPPSISLSTSPEWTFTIHRGALWSNFETVFDQAMALEKYDFADAAGAKDGTLNGLSITAYCSFRTMTDEQSKGKRKLFEDTVSKRAEDLRMEAKRLRAEATRGNQADGKAKDDPGALLDKEANDSSRILARYRGYKTAADASISGSDSLLNASVTKTVIGFEVESENGTVQVPVVVVGE